MGELLTHSPNDLPLYGGVIFSMEEVIFTHGDTMTIGSDTSVHGLVGVS